MPLHREVVCLPRRVSDFGEIREVARDLTLVLLAGYAAAATLAGSLATSRRDVG